eukprot:scaffold24263_cov69-Phaeocystis_antarctica.AAC.7
MPPSADCRVATASSEHSHSEWYDIVSIAACRVTTAQHRAEACPHAARRTPHGSRTLWLTRRAGGQAVRVGNACSAAERTSECARPLRPPQLQRLLRADQVVNDGVPLVAAEVTAAQQRAQPLVRKAPHLQTAERTGRSGWLQAAGCRLQAASRLSRRGLCWEVGSAARTCRRPGGPSAQPHRGPGIG